MDAEWVKIQVPTPRFKSRAIKNMTLELDESRFKPRVSP